MTGLPVRAGLDIGGTKIDAVLLDPDGEIVARDRRASSSGEEAVIGDIADALHALAAAAGIGVDDIASAGVGIPGLIDADSGRVLHAVNLGIESSDLAARASAVLGIRFRIENDVKAAALGASRLHRHDGATAYLNLGTGVAAGIVVDGEIWRGGRGVAGEIGHLSVDPAGRRCGCGQQGCIETLCGGGALARAWGRGGALPIRDIFDAADLGDPEALLLRGDLFRGAAAAVRALILAVDVDRVTIGGGLTALGDRLDAGIRDALRSDAASSPFLESLRLDERIELLPSGSPVAAIGAAMVGAGAPAKEIMSHG